MSKFLNIFKVVLLIIFGVFILSVSVEAAIYELRQNSAQDCENLLLDIYIDVDDAARTSNAAEIIVEYDRNKVQVTELIEGVAFETYIRKIIDNLNGEVKMAGIAYPNLAGTVSGEKLFGRIKFKSVNNIAPLENDFVVYIDPINDTLDSNIADSLTGLDLLSGAINTTFIADCPAYSGGGGYQSPSKKDDSDASDETPVEIFEDEDDTYDSGNFDNKVEIDIREDQEGEEEKGDQMDGQMDTKPTEEVTDKDNQPVRTFESLITDFDLGNLLKGPLDGYVLEEINQDVVRVLLCCFFPLFVLLYLLILIARKKLRRDKEQKDQNENKIE